MKIDFFLPTLMVSVAFLSGCHGSDPTKATQPIDKVKAQIEVDLQKNEAAMQRTKDLMTIGGQPGAISMTGVVVKDNAQLDSRIHLISKSGIGKDGTQSVVADKNKPVLSSVGKKVGLTKEVQEKTLIAVGCDQKTTLQLANERSLKVKKWIADKNTTSILVVTNTLLLCNKLDDIKYENLTFMSDELILNSVDYHQGGFYGKISLSTNRLVLIGSNQIKTGMADSSMILPVGPPAIELNVMKEIDSDEDGQLLISSVGASYKEENSLK